jgi:hypothetical protein
MGKMMAGQNDGVQDAEHELRLGLDRQKFTGTGSSMSSGA